MKCRKCQFENPPGMKFCGACGSRLDVFDQAHRIPEPERKHVTALFSDLTGYTSMTEKLDPEQVKEITGHIFTGVKQIVAKYEGFIERVMGDGCLAFFGIPCAHEDDPTRAIHSAMEIHELVKGLSPQYESQIGGRLTMHSGINTGLVVTADVDTEKGTHGVAGDAVNVASRLSNMAAPDEILVGAETVRRSKGGFQFDELGQRHAKGKVEPIRVFKVIASMFPARGISFDRRVSSAMVGRDKELNKLELLVMKTIDGEGSVVDVIGEAGIGKSRLIAELKRSHIMKRVTLLEGRAISIGKNLSFHPIIDLLKQWAGIAEADSEAAAFDKLEKAIRQVHPEETDEILPFVATLIGMKLIGKYAERTKGIEGESLEKLIFKNVRELMIKGAERRPTVVVMEDFQWADTSSIELLERLYRLAGNHRISFINVFRPGYSEPDDDKIAKMRRGLPASYSEIEIQPLDNANAETLIDNMLTVKKLPHSIKNQIVERAGGNPFFIEEVVRSLIDEGAVVKNNGGFAVTDKIESVTIPPTINDVLTARMDRLEEPTRELIKVASVIGRSFFDRVVKEVADPIGEVDRRLAELKDVQLIRSRTRMGEVEYLFKHALAHEAAYESTLLKQRKQLHLRVAESIERLFSDRLHEFYGILAYHYGKAESLEKAELCLISAGEAALKSSASNEALHYYQEGLSIYRRLRGDSVDPDKVAMLEKNIGLAFFNRGHYAKAVEHFDKVLSYYWGALPKNALSTLFRLLSSFVTFFLALYFPSFWFKRLPTQKDIEAADLYHNKAEALVVIDPKRFFVESFFLHAKIVRFDFRKFKLGIAIFASASALFSWTGISLGIARKVLDYAKPRLDPDNAKQCITYDLLDTIHRVLKGQWNEITEYDEDLVDRILRIGEMWDASMHYYWHGLPKIYQGHFHAARLMVTKLSEIAEAYENDIYRLLKYLLNIHLLIECHEIDEASTEANRGLDFVLAKDWNLHALDMHTLKASIYLLAKETEKAGSSLDQADQIRSEVQAVPSQLSAFYRSQFEYYICHLEDSLRLGHTKESSRYRKEAFKAGKMLIKSSQKVALYRTESYRLMGVYKWLIDDQKGAAKWWRKAISEGEKLGARPQLARTYAEMGIRFCAANGGSSAPDARRAKEHLQKAKQMFRDLGLNHDLAELNSAIDRMGSELSDVRNPLTERHENLSVIK